ncbi:hypothetical protein MAR_020259 [Mya arenaria]|uniref:CCHC-type domain-containing protein n=1 Tax=Mya arenaria TaxID=6604 RepID=A0ABY7E4Y0_MYAAR|nr:hypothetical protein MAR_020259 [Mya arenaria]
MSQFGYVIDGSLVRDKIKKTQTSPMVQYYLRTITAQGVKFVRKLTIRICSARTGINDRGNHTRGSAAKECMYICHYCKEEGHTQAECPMENYGNYAAEIMEGQRSLNVSRSS